MLGTPIEWPLLLACMAWMAHMAAGRAPLKYWSQRKGEGSSVCVDKLGANTESSIVKTGLGRKEEGGRRKEAAECKN